MKRSLFFTMVFLLVAAISFGQDKRSDRILQTDHFGFTTMAFYNYANWTSGKSKASLKFDSFRIWAQTDLNSTIFAGVQYRFYESWRTPTYMYLGWHVNKKNTLKLGQIWAPFGFAYQPYDDWGNLTFYVGLQDDYDMGLTWQGNFGLFTFYAGFFKNQQLSATNVQRYDADVFPGDATQYNLINKRNREVNQFNLMGEFNPKGKNWDILVGGGVMFGQLYNEDTDKYGTRFATEGHLGFNLGNYHLRLQDTWYNYTQKLPDDATQDMKDFLNVSSWNFAYEIPASANVFTASTKYDFIGEKLSAYANYSYLSGGTTETASQLLTGGVSTVWRLIQVYGEVHYGVNDPQMSGNASGYGRDAGSYDVGFQVRVYYTMSILNEKTINYIKKKLSKDSEDKASDDE
jgi:hypothetical protein